jgi:hypothetical protein
VARRLCTVAGFHRYADEEGLVPTSPAVHVIEKGMGPDLYINRSRAAQAEHARQRRCSRGTVPVLNRHSATTGFATWSQRVGSIVGLLEDADADERRQFYQELGLNLIYQRLDGREKVRASLGVEFSRVGGGT